MLTPNPGAQAVIPVDPTGATDNPFFSAVWGVAAAPVASADASAGVAVTDAPTAGQKIVIDELLISVGSGAINLTFKCETSGAIIIGPLYFAVNSTMKIQFANKCKGPKLATADKKLVMFASGAGTVSCIAGYHSEV